MSLRYPKDKYTVNFVRKVNGVNSLVKRKRLRGGKTEISYRKKTYNVDYKGVIQRRGRNYLFLIEIDGAQIYTAEGERSPVSATLLNKIVEDHIASQILGQLAIGLAQGWVIVILAAGMAFMVGYLVGGVFGLGGTP